MKTKKTLASVIIAMILFNTIIFAHFGSKGPYGGAVSCGIVNDTVVYLGTVEGGVFESTKQSLTGWRARPVGLKSGKITALAHTGSYLFTATADSGIFRFTGFVGSDRYWEKVNAGLSNLNIKSLVAIDTITLLAGTDGNGVFKTNNKGSSWTASNTGLPSNAVITCLVKAGSRIYAGCEGNNELYASDDGGVNWFIASTPNIQDVIAMSYNAITNELMAVDATGSVFILDTASTSSDHSAALAQTGLSGTPAIRSVSNNGTNWFLATDMGVYATAAASINWATANTGLTTTDVNVVVPVAFQSSRLVAGTNKNGVFKTDAASISWAANNTSFNNQLTYAMATSGDLVIITATENGVFRSVDLAANYSSANNGLTDSLNVTDLGFLGSNLFAATTNAGMFISPDTGKTWTTFNVGLPETNIKKIMVVNNELFIFSATNKVYQSGGFSWTLTQNGLPGGVVPTAMIAYGNNLLLTTMGNGVYVKTSTGTSWTATNNGLSDLNVTSATVNYNRLYIGTDGSGVFKSDTGAIYWNVVTPLSISHTSLMGLDGSKVQAMASLGNFVFASYKGGLLATSDEGNTWIAGGNQFNLPSYTNVNKISFVTTRVFVTTDNNCIYSNALSELPLTAKAWEVTEASDHDACDAIAMVTVSGGAAPYTSIWSNGQTGATATGLCSETYTVIVTDGSAKTDTTTVTIHHHEITGINNVQKNDAVVVYPNPNNGQFSISLGDEQNVQSVEVFTVSGMLVATIPYDGGVQKLNLNLNVSQGVYLIKVNTPNNNYYKKVIIE